MQLVTNSLCHPRRAAMFQCKTRGRWGESAAKPRAMLCQSALKRSERSLPLTGTKHEEATSWEEEAGGQVTVLRGEEELWAHGLSPHDKLEERRKQGSYLVVEMQQCVELEQLLDPFIWIQISLYSSRCRESSPVAPAQTQFTQQHYMRFCIPAWAAESSAKMCRQTPTHCLKL